MTTIWKYPLEVKDRQTLVLPRDAKVISAGLDVSGQLCLWAVVVPERNRTKLGVLIVGTGNPFEDDDLWYFIDTVVMPPFVWHVFTREE